MLPTIFFCSALLLAYHLSSCYAKDTITMNYSIRDHQGERLISAGKTFELGFFTPDGSSDYRRYIGIWYYGSSLKTVVWVANRDSPLNDTTGVFGIGQDGNLMLSDGNKKSYWSTGLGGLVSFRVIVKLMDSGNLVLSEEDENSGLYRVFWQSFDNPTDTFLPGMKMDENLRLVSWKSKDDPATGSFRFQEDPKRENQYKIIKDKLNLYWKSDTSGKFTDADDIPSIISTLLSNSSGSSFSMGNMYHNSSLNITKTSLLLDYVNRRLVMNFDGKLQCFIKDNASGSWNLTWREPKDKCSVFKACGEFAICRSNNNLLCSCLPGFMPISLGNWNYGDFSEGCKRKTPLCSDDDNKIKEFVKLEVMKVGEPDWTITVERESKCLDECLRHCDCQAYLYKTTQSRGRNGNGTCWIWSEDVNNIQEDYKGKGDEIYLRVSRSDIGGAGIDQDRVIHGRELQWPLFVAVTAVSVTILLSAIFYIYLQRKEAIKQDGRESSQRNVAFHSCNGERRVMDSTDSSQFEEENEKVMDLHFFDFDSILAATDNFSEANKLGKGGFGSVYKGKFSSGQEIAVKRLSTVSGQGQEEFKNEIVLIARLQHRNLVRLLGYCIAGGEKILLYEYMPNKSLDSFIFDTRRCVYMDWEMRFSIILGIARGLLYLHQDSRLRIIHRDLKTSNILLDAEMNPKISDFGLARIFEGTQTEGITKRVVGTYGYMSPEYALDGFFSIKSDVFSFGIVLLEIISGKKNTGFYNSEEGLSLLGHAWRFWQEGNALEIMDKNLRSSKTKDILKCINIGLLCVQENPNDRPTMSEVVIMLSSETANLPSPKQPGFIERRIRHSGITYSLRKLESHAHLTSTLEGR